MNFDRRNQPSALPDAANLIKDKFKFINHLLKYSLY